MKKTLFFCASFLLCSVNAFSQSENADSSADAWVTTHAEEIKQMTPQEWCEIEPKLAQRIYGNFSPEQEIALWEYKFDETLKLDWKPAEREHILALKQFITDNRDIFFESPLSENSKKRLDKFEKEWIDKGINELGWSKYLCGSLSMSAYPLKSTDGTPRIPEEK